MNQFNNLMLKWKLTIGFGVPLALLVGIATTVYFSLNKLLETNRWVNHTYEAIDIGNSITGSLINMETGFRGYMVVGEEHFLEPFHMGKKDFSDLTSRAKQHVSDNAAQVSRLREVESLAARWHAEHTEVGMQYRRDVNRGTLTSEDVSAFIQQGIGKRYMDEMRGILDDFVAAEAVLIGIRDQEQKDTAAATNQITIFGTLLALFLGTLIAWITTRAITGPMAELTNRIQDVRAKSDFSIRLNVDTTDEVGQTATAFNGFMEETQQTFNAIDQTMQSFSEGESSARIEAELHGDLERLKEATNSLMAEIESQQTSERAAAAENSRTTAALKVCQANVMMADADLNIVYMNDSIRSMLGARERELREVLPNFEVRNLMGTCVDDFHKNPAHQRGILTELKSVYETSLDLNDLTFGLIATPVFGAEGERVGTVVEWEDKTERLAAEKEAKRIADENARVKQALDNVGTATMIADPDFNVIYMNGSANSVMKNAESDIRKDLPNFDANSLMGTNIDIFHQNPSHQRNLVGHLKGSFTSELKIGGRTMTIVANPIEVDGERLGTVVEWVDRTAEVSIEKEINHLVDAANQGDFTIQLPQEGKDGFFLNLTEGLNSLTTTANTGLTDVLRVINSMSGGDLTNKIEADYQGIFGSLKDGTNTTIDKLKEVISEIRSASVMLSSGASEIATGNADLSKRTEQQASSLEETASSMEEMTSVVKQGAENSKNADDLAQNAKTKATDGGVVVKRAINAMDEINTSSKEIADIIGVIEEIAFQTNLLALNAAVEAARAGEQGRGFAVVAGEVRNLAQRSADASKEIKDLIRNSETKVSEGSNLVNESGKTLADIEEAVIKVSAMIADISAGAEEQTSGIEQVNTAVAQMDEVTQQNAALVEEASASSEAVSDRAVGLAKMMDFFDTGDSPSSSVSASSSSSSSTMNSPAAVSHATVSHSGGHQDADDDWQEF